MSKAAEASSPKEVKERIIIALDVDSADEARRIVNELAAEVGAFKIGLQLFTSCGPQFVRELAAAGHKIFLDLKFHDIPSTVARASAGAAKLGVWMFNVHASGGEEMMRAAKNARDEWAGQGIHRPLVIGVTVLTSSTDQTLVEVGVAENARDQVERLARLAADSGLDGVVASAQEAGLVRKVIEDTDFAIVTPGIRSVNATADDQKRVTSLGQAIAAGSTYVVIGRPVTAAPDRRRALVELLDEAN